MGLKEMKAVSNTGPILHLLEIDLTKSLKIFNEQINQNIYKHKKPN